MKGRKKMSIHKMTLKELREELTKYVELCYDTRSMGEIENYVTVSFFAEWAEYLLDILEEMEKRLERVERHSDSFLEHNKIIGGFTR